MNNWKTIVLFSFCFSFAMALPRGPISSARFEQLAGISKTDVDEKNLWDKKFSKPTFVYGKKPEKFLVENMMYIPRNSKILDLGMGEGRHAVYMASKGHAVTGLDISSVAIKKAKKLAREFGVEIETVRASARDYDFKENSFDVIVCFYYVDKELNKKIQRWLRPGGILIYESFTLNQSKVKGFEKYSSEYMLRPSELLNMFDEMTVLKYEEPLHEKAYRASIILRK